MYLKKYLVLLFLFVPLKIIFSGTYFIDPINGSIYNNGSKQHPWSTLEEVLKIKSIKGKDTLVLLSGFHGENIILTGKSNLPIVIVAGQNESPRLLQINIKGSNWIIDGLNFNSENRSNKGTPRFFDNGVFLILDSTSSNNIVRNCIFQSIENSEKWSIDDWRKNVWSGIRDFGKNNIIRKNLFKNIAYAIELNETAKLGLIEKNIIENFSGDGIRIGGADSCTVQYNKIINGVELDPNPKDGNHEDGIQSWVGKVNDDAVHNLVIRGNYIQSYTDTNQSFVARNLQGISLFDGPYKNLLIENNVVIIEHWHGIALFGAYNCLIINNTVLPIPGTFPYVAGPPWIGIFSHKNGTPSKNNIIRNNIAENMVIKNNGAIADNNLIDPVAFKFVNDYKNFDFTPKPNFVYGGNTIIDSGNSKSAPKIDFNGVSRPQGKEVDIGAFELQYECK